LWALFTGSANARAIPLGIGAEPVGAHTLPAHTGRVAARTARRIPTGTRGSCATVKVDAELRGEDTRAVRIGTMTVSTQAFPRCTDGVSPRVTTHDGTGAICIRISRWNGRWIHTSAKVIAIPSIAETLAVYTFSGSA